MCVRLTVLLVFFLVLLNGYHVGFAQEKKINKTEQQIVELQKMIEEMEKEHTVEIKKLKEKVQELSLAVQKKKEEEDLSDLRRLAETEAAKEEVVEEPVETVFKAGGLSLQDLNPEISVTGDMIYTYREQEGIRRHSDFTFRNLGLHFESYLDPYTRFKAAVPVNENGAELGEAYITRFGIFNVLNLTAGKFRQQFGVVNRWHKHGLDQVDFPLALRMIFGNGGLNQTGISVDWTLPSFLNTSQELILQVTDGENKRLFNGDIEGYPSVLLHYKNYRDLTKDTYLEFGLTGLIGWNDEWDVVSGGSVQQDYDTLGTHVFGADLSMLWEPTDRMRYRNLEWRTEAYVLNRDIRTPDNSGRDTLNAWGIYSYIQSKLSRRWVLGIRGDYYEPDTKDYAEIPNFPDLSLTPLACKSSDAYRWGVSPYMTWYQSPFVRIRLEYEHFEGHGMEKTEDAAMLQLIFAAGPHKHERY